MADKKLNEVPEVVQIKSLFGRLADGTVVQISTENIASVLGGLITNGSYIRVTSYDSYALYKFDFTRNTNAILRVVGEGNSDIADDYSTICSHNEGKALAVTHNSGSLRIKIYRDNDFNYYVYIAPYGHAILYFDNRIPVNNTISATSVDIGILGTLTQVGI